MSSAPVHVYAPRSKLAVLIAGWGVFGVVVVLVSAIVRLTPLALEPLSTGMTTTQWLLYVSWSLINLYAEGYRGFQRSFVPRVVARAFYVARHRRPLHVALAPIFCMGLFFASRRRLIASWSIVIGVSALVALIRGLEQPWRGIVDAGVVIGLAYGTASLVVSFVAALAGRPIVVSPQVPAHAPQ